MKLSDFFEKPLRDGSFEHLGYLTSRRGSNLLSYLSENQFLPEYLENKRNIACILTTKEVAKVIGKDDRVGIAISKDPTRSFYELHNKLTLGGKYDRTKRRKSILKSSRIHRASYVSPFGVLIEENVTIEPRAVVLPGVTIGSGSVIRAGAIVGSEGFENKRIRDGLLHVEHAGNVTIGEDVEIGANACICRGLFPYDTTTIGSHSKIDQLVHVAHNVQIGKNCIIVASALIGGSTVLENDCWIGPSAVVTNNIRIGKNAFITLGSVVTRDVKPGQKVSGVWAIDHDKFVRLMKSHDS